jgi:hypothetical protein
VPIARISVSAEKSDRTNIDPRIMHKILKKLWHLNP